MMMMMMMTLGRYTARANGHWTCDAVRRHRRPSHALILARYGVPYGIAHYRAVEGRKLSWPEHQYGGTCSRLLQKRDTY